MNEIRRFQGDPVHHTPRSGRRWTPIDGSTATDDLEEAAVGLMGELNAYEFTDRLLPSGLYRMFAYETPIGVRISALKFTGTMGAGGVADDTTDGLNDPTTGTDPGTDPFADPGQTTVGTVGDGSGPGNVSGGDPNDPNSGAVEGQQYGTGGNAGGGAGTTTSEPQPPTSSSCGAWTASTSNAQVVGVAQSISYSNSPVAWSDQAIYYMTASDGTYWALTQWWENGLKMVAAHVCTQPLKGQTKPSTGLSVAVMLAIVGAAGAAAVIGLSAVRSHKRMKAHRHAA